MVETARYDPAGYVAFQLFTINAAVALPFKAAILALKPPLLRFRVGFAWCKVALIYHFLFLLFDEYH